MEKPEIVYPCVWPYRVIGSDAELIKNRIEKVLAKNSFQLGDGNSSRQGTYSSVHVEVSVAHEAERNEVFQALKAISGVKMVF